MAEQQEIDDHRRELLNEDYESFRFGKSFINAGIEEIKGSLVERRDKSRFTEDDMLRKLDAFLQRQRGISRLANEVYEIKGPLKR